MDRGPYTAWDDEAIEGFVQRRLDRIVEVVRRQMGDDLEAILLSGGFGRGEGGVLRMPDGMFRVINDFDLELVYREPLGRLASKLRVQLRHRRALHGLAESLATEFDMKQVDLSLRAAHTLQAAIPKLADYDLLHGHKLLWGDVDPTVRMRAFQSADIPAFEGAWLLRNRGIGLVLARLYLDRGHLHDENSENFYIEINKAALAMGDALWILAGRYTVHYAGRAADFDSLAAQGYPQMAALSAAYRQAAEYKLRPVLRSYPGESPEALWERIAGLYVDFFLWFESRRHGRAFAHLGDYATWLGTQPTGAGGGRLRRWMDAYLGTTGSCPASLQPLKHQPATSVLFVAALVAARLADPSAVAVLGRWPLAAEEGAAHGWQVRARGLLSLMHPGGEVGRFLSSTAGAASTSPSLRAA